MTDQNLALSHFVVGKFTDVSSERGDYSVRITFTTHQSKLILQLWVWSGQGPETDAHPSATGVNYSELTLNILEQSSSCFAEHICFCPDITLKLKKLFHTTTNSGFLLRTVVLDLHVCPNLSVMFFAQHEKCMTLFAGRGAAVLLAGMWEFCGTITLLPLRKCFVVPPGVPVSAEDFLMCSYHFWYKTSALLCRGKLTNSST